jgi:hypothetical protein
MAKFTMLAALALGFGCSDKNSDSVGEGDSDTDADSDTDTDTDPSGGTVSWSGTGVTVDITGGSGDLKFGIVENNPDPWVAEDCIGGDNGTGSFCHTVQANGSTTIPCVSDYKDVTDDTTLFCGIAESSLTYYFASMDDSWCAVSGPDHAYYGSMGCDNWDK